ncbi:MAG: NAD(P)-dependent alcohol dehydrogenase [Acidobacteriota bacterium]|nr:NAD(P)-dependent alcohol dehydrogenase [Acidobacteriota bacterium]
MDKREHEAVGSSVTAVAEEPAGIRVAGYAAPAAKAPIGPFTFERRAPGPHDVLIEILYCGVCHSDIHQARDDWREMMPAIFPMVPGHEIVGKVVRVGDQVEKWKAGDTVGVGCIVDSCRECGPCRAGEEQYCEKGATPTYNGYERDGKTPTYGGYSTQVTVDENYVVRIPDGLPLEGAAPLLCAGITTYSPLRHHGVKAGDKVAIVGLGGLGHMGVKIAKALGANVTVLSHSPGKREDALRLGADDFIATNDPSVFEKNAERFDVILDTVSARHDYNSYLGLLRLDGTMVLLGLPEKATPVAAGLLIMKRRNLTGSGIGGIRETQEMLDFCAEHGIVSDVEVIPIQRINEAYERTLASDVRYRFVIDSSSLRS